MHARSKSRPHRGAVFFRRELSFIHHLPSFLFIFYFPSLVRTGVLCSFGGSFSSFINLPSFFFFNFLCLACMRRERRLLVLSTRNSWWCVTLECFFLCVSFYASFYMPGTGFCKFVLPNGSFHRVIAASY